MLKSYKMYLIIPLGTCPAGTKIDSTDTGCDPCPRGTYQPDAYQKDCIPCEDDTSTRMVNSTKKSDCESMLKSVINKQSHNSVAFLLA